MQDHNHNTSFIKKIKDKQVLHSVKHQFEHGTKNKRFSNNFTFMFVKNVFDKINSVVCTQNLVPCVSSFQIKPSSNYSNSFRARASFNSQNEENIWTRICMYVRSDTVLTKHIKVIGELIFQQDHCSVHLIIYTVPTVLPLNFDQPISHGQYRPQR